MRTGMPVVRIWRPACSLCSLTSGDSNDRADGAECTLVQIWRWMSRETVLSAVIVLVAAQAGWIAALLVSRARRRRTEARNNAILRALPDLMFVQTRDGVYVDYNARDESLLYVPPSQF